MTQFKAWPPPRWAEIIIMWDDILKRHFNPNEMYAWCDEHASKGRYHVHGWQATQGFAFRFERKEDATMFALRWS